MDIESGRRPWRCFVSVGDVDFSEGQRHHCRNGDGQSNQFDDSISRLAGTVTKILVNEGDTVPSRPAVCSKMDAGEGGADQRAAGSRSGTPAPAPEPPAPATPEPEPPPTPELPLLCRQQRPHPHLNQLLETPAAPAPVNATARLPLLRCLQPSRQPVSSRPLASRSRVDSHARSRR